MLCLQNTESNKKGGLFNIEKLNNPVYNGHEVDKMIYQCKNPVTKIVGVARMQWKESRFQAAPRSFSALAFKVAGTATMTVNGQKYSIGTNDILYLPQGLGYSEECTDTEIVVIHFQAAMDDPAPEVYSFANTEQIYKAFLSAQILWQNKAPGYEAYVQSQLYYIFGKLCESDARVKLPESFLKTLSYMNANYTDSTLSIGKICTHSGISATGLRTLFKQHYGKTPVEYLTNLRLEYARNLIACGVSVETAAEQSGFNDSKYFARVVKKYFHCTPRELKLHGK